MGLHDQLAIKAYTMGKKSKEFTGAAQQHAKASVFLLIIAGVVWYFSDNWIWALIPVALMVFIASKSISATSIASKLEALEPNDQPDVPQISEPQIEIQELTTDFTNVIVNDFKIYIEKHGSSGKNLDEAGLPHSKGEIYNALIATLRETDDEEKMTILRNFMGQLNKVGN